MSFAGAATGGTKVCGIIACTGDSLNTCGKLFEPNKKFVAPVTFRSIDIRLPKAGSEKNFFMPGTLAKNMQPLNATDFSFGTVGSKEAHDYYGLALKKPSNDLLSFVLLGRNFALDGGPPTRANIGGPMTKGLSSLMSSCPVVVWTVVSAYLVVYFKHL